MYKKETIRIHKAWKELKQYVKRWDNKLAYKNAKSLVNNLSNFKELYYSAKGDRSQSGTIIQKLKSTLRFKTSLRTAKALKGASTIYLTGKTKKGTARKKALRFVKKEITGKSVRELRNMNTHDIVRDNPDMKEDIKQMYHELRTKGMTAKEAGKQISSFYFGS